MSNKKFAVLSLAWVLIFSMSGLLLAQTDDESTNTSQDDLSFAQSDALKAAIGKQRSEIADEKDEFGARKVRSGYSQIFKLLDDGTREVSVMIDKAGPAVMTTEHQKWIFKPTNESMTAWEFVSSKTVDSWESQVRWAGDAEVFSFGKLNFDNGGMKVTGSNGQLVGVKVDGNLDTLIIAASDLSYDYTPPTIASGYTDIPYYKDTYRLLANDPDRKKDIIFDPTFVSIQCDPISCENILNSYFESLTSKGEYKAEISSVPSIVSSLKLSAEAAEAVKQLYGEFIDQRKENGFAGFQLPPNEDNLTWDIRVWRDDEHALALYYDNWGGFEYTLYSTPGTGYFGYYTRETLKNIDPYVLELREDKGFHEFHVDGVKGTIEVGIGDDDERINGDIEFTLEAKKDIKYLPFRIANNDGDRSTAQARNALAVNALQFDGEELTRITNRYGGVAKLPREVKAGEKFTIQIQYSARVMRKMNPTFTQVSRGGWMPFVSFGDMIPEFELTMKFPSRYNLLGIGKKRWEKDDGKVKTAFWKADKPVVFASFTLGKYIQEASDFQATKPNGDVIPVNVFVDEVTTQAGSGALGERGIRAKQLGPIAEQAAVSIDMFTKFSGVEYPYGELNLVADPLGSFYGQAPSSLVYLGFGVFRGEGAVSLGGGKQLAKFNKSVVAHEIGHQWWGAAITNANSRNYWFVETLAEYFSAIYLERVFGRKDYMEQVSEWRNRVLDVDTFQSVQNASTFWGGPNPGAAYQALVYNKGPLAFHVMRTTFGDEKFFDYLKKFTMALAEKGEIVTRDIQMVSEEMLGGVNADGQQFAVDMEWFFDQWIRDIAVPEYSFAYDVTQAEDGGYIIRGKVYQKLFAGSQYTKLPIEDRYFRAKVPITVTGKDKQEYTVPLVVEGPVTEFGFKVGSKPVEVELNKYLETFAYDVKPARM